MTNGIDNFFPSLDDGALGSELVRVIDINFNGVLNPDLLDSSIF
jgi:hypothetical protein